MNGLICFAGIASITGIELVAARHVESEVLDHWSTADVSLLQTQLSLQKERWSTSRPGSILSKNALQLLNGVKERPLLMWSDHAAQVRFDIGPPPRVNAAHPLLCQAYHKTGTEICAEFLQARSQVTGELFVGCWLESDCVDVARSGAPNTSYQLEVESGIPLLDFLGDKPFRMLNFVREPVDLIISGYRYHLLGVEDWLSDPLPHEVISRVFNKQDQDFLFSLCAEGCNYLELLSAADAVNESVGVLVESIMEKANMNVMTSITTRFANDPRVLHLSVDHLKKDFNQTMRCINNFLDGKDIEAQQLNIFQSFNPESPAYLEDRHVTSGMYNNTPLEQFLWSQPMWAHDFASHKEFTSQLFEREADRFGCPMP